MFVCKSCFEVYDSYRIIVKVDKFLIESICPKHDCQGELVEIDDYLIDPIISLWKSGIATFSCCSGHNHNYSHNRNGYVEYGIFPNEDLVKLNDITNISKDIIKKYEYIYLDEKWGISENKSCIHRMVRTNKNNYDKLDFLDCMQELVLFCYELSVEFIKSKNKDIPRNNF
jgi:hypothetical protein